MEFRDYIEKAADTAGGIPALADAINQLPDIVRKARRGERGLPEKACVLIARLADADPIAVIAARERALAKTDEDRTFWKKVAAISAFFVLSGAPLPPESRADTGFSHSALANTVYYVKWRIAAPGIRHLTGVHRIRCVLDSGKTCATAAAREPL